MLDVCPVGAGDQVLDVGIRNREAALVGLTRAAGVWLSRLRLADWTPAHRFRGVELSCQTEQCGDV